MDEPPEIIVSQRLGPMLRHHRRLNLFRHGREIHGRNAVFQRQSAIHSNRSINSRDGQPRDELLCGKPSPVKPRNTGGDILPPDHLQLSLVKQMIFQGKLPAATDHLKRRVDIAPPSSRMFWPDHEPRVLRTHKGTGRAEFFAGVPSRCNGDGRLRGSPCASSAEKCPCVLRRAPLSKDTAMRSVCMTVRASKIVDNDTPEAGNLPRLCPPHSRSNPPARNSKAPAMAIGALTDWQR